MQVHEHQTPLSMRCLTVSTLLDASSIGVQYPYATCTITYFIDLSPKVALSSSRVVVLNYHDTGLQCSMTGDELCH